MKTVAVIMAGGKGERFWPESRESLPKQFLAITDESSTMLQQTVSRLDAVVAVEDVYVVTGEKYADIVLNQIPKIPNENVILEPMSKNTAPCIGLALEFIAKKYEQALVMVLASDHAVKDSRQYLKTLETALQMAQEGNNIVTIGITPSYPETGYGYIQYDSSCRRLGTYPVKKFVEKPDYERAVEYINEGGYLWNSGMFVFTLGTVQEAFSKYLPDMKQHLKKIGQSILSQNYKQVLKEEYNQIEPISIDYGIMEKCPNIFTVPGNFGWDDVGSWLALKRIYPSDENHNVIVGEVLCIDTKDSIIKAGERLVVTVGLEHAVVVDMNDVLLVMHDSKCQDIKKVIAKLKERGMEELL